MSDLNTILDYCKEQAFDLGFAKAKEWKASSEGRVLVGYFPIYFPRELIHAMNGLAVGIMGTGDRKQLLSRRNYHKRSCYKEP